MVVRLWDIRSDFTGFARLAALAARTETCFLETVQIDMSLVSFCAANMCSPLGAVLHRISRRPNTIEITGLRPQVESILAKNGFLRNYGYAVRPDTYGTTIEYVSLEPGDDRFFGTYIERYLIGKDIPEMSTALAKKFRESIFEIFSNAAIHSRTKMGIFSCGQSFPKAHRLDFCITDLGIGFRRNILEQTGQDFEAQDAIAWAVEGSNTTKRGKIPGGLGLKLLREFIHLNKGKIQIVSDAGYWEQSQDGSVRKTRLGQRFPGTAVNIEINTADSSSYCLESEIQPSDVF